jgi:hypothetical protein
MMIWLSFHVMGTGYRFTEAKYCLGAGKAEEMILKFKIMINFFFLAFSFWCSSRVLWQGVALVCKLEFVISPYF